MGGHTETTPKICMIAMVEIIHETAHGFRFLSIFDYLKHCAIWNTVRVKKQVTVQIANLWRAYKNLAMQSMKR